MNLDEVARTNQERWDALVAANVAYSQPMLDLDRISARRLIDPYDLAGDLEGRDVLCLASGGGQQSVACALLGAAQVTVFDLSPAQLARDREAAAHYGLSIRTVQGDMRDLSAFDDESFDLIWHAFSINFVPESRPVLDEVARVLRPGGLYRIQLHNPFTAGLDETDWNGAGYPLRQPYVDGAELQFSDPHWEVWDDEGGVQRVVGPREFRHTLGPLLNRLIGHGFALLGLWEELTDDPDAEPGTWEHLKYVAPPYLTLWFRYAPGML
jgi:ubiquinone/menaquinone biosynthesis C-methylase UbiE